jgi:type IV pilus assembly protein PilN
MRLNINLASRPYQDLSRFLRRWMLAVGVFAVASIAFGLFAWHQYSAGRDINRRISAQEEQIHQFDEQKAAATKLLNEPSNKDVADTARFLNLLIAKKSFSWTRVFMQLEEILPAQLHVVSLSPELTSNNQLQLTMRVAGNSREQAVELVRRIEKSPSFRSPALRSETMLPPDQARGTDAVLFEISALYVPTLPPAAAPVKDTKSVTKNDAAPQNDASTTASVEKKGARP